MEKYQSLRREYPRFYYKSYVLWEDEKEVRLTYHFEIQGLSSFAPSWRFPKALGDKARWRDDVLFQKMAFSLGMVELVSYWKITCSPHVIVEAGGLNGEQIHWWKDLYFNGLGEFFYVNGIREAEPDDFMDITCQANEDSAVLSFDPRTFSSSEKVLVPIGGGKDSAVTLELLKKSGASLWAYIINPRGATVKTAEAAGLPGDRVIKAGRTLDKNMLELNIL